MFYYMDSSLEKFLMFSQFVHTRYWTKADLYIQEKLPLYLAAVLIEKETEAYLSKARIPYITIFHTHVSGDLILFAFKISNEGTLNGPH